MAARLSSIRPFALGQSQLNLDPTFLKVQPQRNQGQSLLLCFAHQTHDFSFMQEELTPAVGVAVEIMGRFVVADMRVQ